MDQFRVHTEFSFRTAFGQLPKVIAAGKTVGAKAMAITDPNSFGHISFFKKAKDAGIQPILGAELRIRANIDDDDQRSGLFYACSSEGLSELYGWMTIAAQQGGALSYDDVAEMGGSIAVAAGSAASDALIESIQGPAFLEANPASVMLRQRAIDLAKRHRKLILPTSDIAYPRVSDRKAAELLGVRLKTTPQWMLTQREAQAFMRELPASAYNTHEHLRELCKSVALPRAENIREPMDLNAVCRAAITGKYPGKRWTKVYEDRLKRELVAIRAKGFDDYFAMISGICRFAKERMLVGPARGSSAGSLVCYLLDITEIDPIKHDLLFERFIDETRSDYPDIDIDFPDETREQVFDYLRDRYGEANVAKLGTVSRLKARSAIGAAAKRLGIPFFDTQEIKAAIIDRAAGDVRAHLCISDTFNEIETGKNFVAKYPAMSYAGELEAHASHSGVHAAGALVCNAPVRNYCTINAHGIAQIDKKDAEIINLMKVDILGLRTLSVLAETKIDVRHVALDDPAALAIFNDKRYTGIFQFEGRALQAVCNEIGVHDFEDIVAETSLARPGPLQSGATASYVARKLGREKIESVHPVYDRITSSTYGALVYQEQIMSILRELGGMDWPDVQALRKMMSKSMGAEVFAPFYVRFEKGAVAKGMDAQAASVLWARMVEFGSYAFNRSHAVAYAIISYWCAWLKAHHPLIFAHACLKHAKDDEQAIKMLREIVGEGQIEYIPFDADHSQASFSIFDGKLLGGLKGIKGVGDKTAAKLIEHRAAGTLTAREATLLANPVLTLGDLFPAQRQFGDYYATPIKYGVEERIWRLSEIPVDADGAFVVIARMTSREERDLNEPDLVKMRGGKRFARALNFLSVELEDDTDKIFSTVGRDEYPRECGQALRAAPVGSWWLLRCSKRKEKRKLYIKKARRIDA